MKKEGKERVIKGFLKYVERKTTWVDMDCEDKDKYLLELMEKYLSWTRR